MPLPYISIDNFRAFREKTEFEFPPVTILTGTNSSGKSSLVDALRILQNYTDEFTEPDKNDFWDRIINFKEDYFNYRIPGFEDLVNYINPERKSIYFEFKSRFIGMAEDVTICFEFIDKDGVNGILNSLKFKNDKGEDFFSMVIKEDNLPHLEIDFGFLSKKFEEEIKKEIEHYDTISNANSSSINQPQLIESSEYEIIKEDFEKNEPFYDKTGYYDKHKKPTPTVEPKPNETTNPSNENVIREEYIAFIEEIKRLYSEEINNIINDAIELQPSITTRELYRILFDAKRDFKNKSTEIINGDDISCYSEDTKNMLRDMTKTNPVIDIETEILSLSFPKDIQKRFLDMHYKPKRDKLRLQEILKGKLSIGISEYAKGLGEINRSIKTFFTNPVQAIFFSNYDEGEYIYDNREIHKFLWDFFDNDDNFIMPNETMTGLGQLFYNKFVNDNILNSIKELNKRLVFDFIPSIRNSPDRFYTKKKEAYFENILVDFYSKYSSFNDDIKAFINKYLSLFGIGDRIETKRDAGFGIYSIIIFKKEREINLMDLGYGISQVIPILLKIALTASDEKIKSIIIEEPETNLHPALQSKLADMFIEASKPPFGIQFIIETHSEYLIRKLQYLTAKAEIKPEDTVIYYFHHPDNVPDGEPQVKKININEGGVLSDDFGPGFFDEADKIAMSIWSMNQSQKN